MSSRKYYITAPFHRAASVPHLGHAYSIIAADIFVRYKRGRGLDAHFLAGTSVHGERSAKAASAEGVSAPDWARAAAGRYRELWRRLNISNDDFLLTSEPRHAESAVRAFEKLLASGDIYKGLFDGFYCPCCENFYGAGELSSGGLCPVHSLAAERVREDVYFFRLSKYADSLLEHYLENPEFIMPELRAGEMLEIIRAGLRDVPVSRASAGWGIPAPSGTGQTLLPWWESLLGYVSPAEAFWPADLQFTGADGCRRHAIVFPAVLMALALPLPDRIFVHGAWRMDGKRISGVSGGGPDTLELLREYGSDALRYFLFRELPFGGDGEFSAASLRRRYNIELAGDIAGLVSRTANMVDLFLGGELPARPPQGGFRLLDFARAAAPGIEARMEAMEFSLALDGIWAVIGEMNREMSRSKPRVMAESDPAGLKLFLFEMVWCLRMAATWLEPFMPDAAVRIHCQLGVRTPSPTEDGGASIAKAPFLFPRR